MCLTHMWLILRRREVGWCLHVMSHIYIMSLQKWQHILPQALCPNTVRSLQKVLSCFHWDILFGCTLEEAHIRLTFEVESQYKMSPDALKGSEYMAYVKMCSDSCLYLLCTWCSWYYIFLCFNLEFMPWILILWMHFR